MYTLRGIELRYVLTMHLARHGRSTIDELIDAMTYHGFAARDPANKSVSDALRWERRRGRVRRIGRGIYGPGYIPRGTEHRILQRELALRAEAIRSEAGTTHPPNFPVTHVADAPAAACVTLIAGSS
jgi:hypothetical protein